MASTANANTLPRMSLVAANANVDDRRASYLSMSKLSAAMMSNKPPEEEVIERILRAADPNVMSTPVYFDYRKEARTFRLVPSVGSTTMHFAQDGVIIRKDGTEAMQQEEDRNRRIKEVALAAEAELNPDLVEEGVSTKILKNQFNYSTRGSQTMNNAIKEKNIFTDPPPSVSFGGMATAWSIYDAYMADRLQSERATRKKSDMANRASSIDPSMLTQSSNNANSSANAGNTGNAINGDGGNNTTSINNNNNDFANAMEDTNYNDNTLSGAKLAEAMPKNNAAMIMESKSLSSVLKIMERMVNQNDGFDIVDDFKYWEDRSDLYKDDGTLLPLWQFYTEATKKRAVTCIALNQRYHDIFVVGYGSYDFQRPCRGTIHCFTLKNAVPMIGGNSIAAAPEFTFRTSSGVMCLSFHPTQTSLLACGLYSGVVCVYDLRDKSDRQKYKPLYQSTICSGTHTEPLWEIYWTNKTKELVFYSISTDGRVLEWKLYNKELTSKEVTRLCRSVASADPQQLALSQLSGTCMDYSPLHDKCVMGTYEGAILLCNPAYDKPEMTTFDGHDLTVYAVRWNPFHREVFISCSADWTVKVWLVASHDPLMTFDLGDSVGDVAWSPYSATVFAAVTGNGKVYVFDLAQNKTEPLCVQTVVKNAKLTHIVFSRTDPIVFVGDSRGTVLTLKLSPNLRKRGEINSKKEKNGSNSVSSSSGSNNNNSSASSALMVQGSSGTGLANSSEVELTAHQIEARKLSKLIEITLKDRVLLGRV